MIFKSLAKTRNFDEMGWIFIQLTAQISTSTDLQLPVLSLRPDFPQIVQLSTSLYGEGQEDGELTNKLAAEQLPVLKKLSQMLR